MFKRCLRFPHVRLNLVRDDPSRILELIHDVGWTPDLCNIAARVVVVVVKAGAKEILEHVVVRWQVISQLALV